MEDRIPKGPVQGENRYQAYLVRLWQDTTDTPWRALARNAEDGEECRFATVEHLFLFLHRRTEGAEPDRSPSADCEPEGALERS
jgi:hypothetical protein